MKFTICDYISLPQLRCSRCFKVAPLRSLLYPRETGLGHLGSYCDDCIKWMYENCK